MGKFNQALCNYGAEKKKKERVKRKLRGTVEKHRKAVKAVSGKRTKKAQRRVAHHAHLAQAEAQKQAAGADEAGGQEEMVEAGPAPVSAKVLKRRDQKKLAKARKPTPMQE